MRIIIVGDNIFALALAQKLKRKENELVIVVKDKEKAFEVSAESEVTVINSNPSNVEELDKLDLPKCDVFIAATDNDGVNVLSAVYVNSKGVKKIFVKLNNPDLDAMLQKMGMHTINPQEYAADGVALNVLKPLVADLVGLERGDYNISERYIDRYKNLIGKNLGLLKGEFFVTLSVYKEGSFKLSADTVIDETSTIIILYERGKAKELDKALKSF